MRLLLIGVLTSGLVLAGCSDDGSRNPLVRDLNDLCRATAGRVDLGQQESAFFDRAHDAIHELARRVTEEDPGLGAALLEAKQQIEAGLTETSDDPIPSRPFRRLVDATNDALSSIELPMVSC